MKNSSSYNSSNFSPGKLDIYIIDDKEIISYIPKDNHSISRHGTYSAKIIVPNHARNYPKFFKTISNSLNTFTHSNKTRKIGLQSILHVKVYLAGFYLLKVKNRNTRTRCKICSKLTIKTPERCQWHRSGVLIVNFEHVSQLVLVFLFLVSFYCYLWAGKCQLARHLRLNNDNLSASSLKINYVNHDDYHGYK